MPIGAAQWVEEARLVRIAGNSISSLLSDTNFINTMVSFTSPNSAHKRMSIRVES